MIFHWKNQLELSRVKQFSALDWHKWVSSEGMHRLGDRAAHQLYSSGASAAACTEVISILEISTEQEGVIIID